MTRNQLIAHLIVQWIAPRLRREQLSWSQCPIHPTQLAQLANRMRPT